MGAGIQRWWRDGSRFEAETAMYSGQQWPRLVCHYTMPRGTVVNVYRERDGRMFTIHFAPGSISYTDGIT